MKTNPLSSSSQMLPGRRTLFFGLLLILVTLVHLGAQLVDPDSILSDVTQMMLMPALIGVLFSGTAAVRPKMIRWVLLALVFSWLGDSIPRFLNGDPGFLTMVGCFLVAQVFYVLALLPHWRHSIVLTPWWIIPYLAALAMLVLLCAPGAGALLVPVIVYGIALTIMAVLSTGLGKMAGLGGAIFFVSDSLIALRSFADINLPAHSFWIMFTYVLGQALIAVAVIRFTRTHKAGS